MSDARLQTNLAGITLKNPLMPGSGPLTGDDERMLELAGLGLGGLVTKTIAKVGAEVVRPCIVSKNNIIMNCEAWSEHASERWIEEFLPSVAAKSDVPVIASVGYGPEDYEWVVPKIDHLVAGYECVARFHNNSGDYTEVRECVRAFRQLTKRPIWVKMSANKPDLVAFGKTCVQAGANGVVAITSLGPCLAVDIGRRRPMIGLSTGFSWASGPAIKPVALSAVYLLKKEVPGISIIGSGGIATAEDVVEFLLAGADAVEMLSAAMMKGKRAYQKILADLPGVLAKYGFADIEDVKRTGLREVEATCTPTFPKVDEQACRGCRLCADNCPYRAMGMRGGKAVVDTGKCFGCGLCQSLCPVDAIENVL